MERADGVWSDRQEDEEEDVEDEVYDEDEATNEEESARWRTFANAMGKGKGKSFSKGIRLPAAMSSDPNKAKMRGTLPKAPEFNGDKRKDPQCYRKYCRRVDTYVEIALKIISEEEIGLRLYDALSDDAFDFLEGVPAKTFGVKNGWKALLEVLKHFDEPPILKMGTSMDGFFKLEPLKSGETYEELAVRIDKAAQKCSETGLVIPDPIKIRYFFIAAAFSDHQQATLLMSTGGAYDWSALKKSVATLYPRPQKMYLTPQRDFHRKPRSAHEVHQEEQPNHAQVFDMTTTDSAAAAAADDGSHWWPTDYDQEWSWQSYDKDEDVDLPEELQAEMHTAYMTYKGSRQRLQQAVIARGFYRGKGDAKGRPSYKGGGGKGSGFGGGKGKGGKDGGKSNRKGTGLAELKARTHCAVCGEKGHWQSDPQCKGKSTHMAEHAQESPTDWYSPVWEPPPAEAINEAHTASRITLMNEEVEMIADRVRNIRGVMQTSRAPRSSESLVSEIQGYLRGNPRFAQATAPMAQAAEELKRALDKHGIHHTFVCNNVKFDQLLSDDQDPEAEVSPGEAITPKVKTVFAAARFELDDTMIIVDTACQTTVSGTSQIKRYDLLVSRQGLQLQCQPENELYRFGPGQPVPSRTRYGCPAAIGGRPVIIYSSAIDDTKTAKLPWLGGRDLFSDLRAIISFEDMSICCLRLGVVRPLLPTVSGHLGVRLDEWDEGFTWQDIDRPPAYSSHALAVMDVAKPAEVAPKECHGARKVTSTDDPVTFWKCWTSVCRRVKRFRDIKLQQHPSPASVVRSFVYNNQSGELLHHNVGMLKFDEEFCFPEITDVCVTLLHVDDQFDDMSLPEFPRGPHDRPDDEDTVQKPSVHIDVGRDDELDFPLNERHKTLNVDLQSIGSFRTRFATSSPTLGRKAPTYEPASCSKMENSVMSSLHHPRQDGPPRTLGGGQGSVPPPVPDAVAPRNSLGRGDHARAHGPCVTFQDSDVRDDASGVRAPVLRGVQPRERVRELEGLQALRPPSDSSRGLGMSCRQGHDSSVRGCGAPSDKGQANSKDHHSSSRDEDQASDQRHSSRGFANKFLKFFTALVGTAAAGLGVHSHASGLGLGGRAGGGDGMISELSELKPGQTKRLLGMARDAAQNLSAEKSVYAAKLDSANFKRSNRPSTMLELYYEKGPLLSNDASWMRPVDMTKKIDVVSIVDKWKPRCVVCMSERFAQEDAKQADAVMMSQVKRGDHAMWPGSKGWISSDPLLERPSPDGVVDNILSLFEKEDWRLNPDDYDFAEMEVPSVKGVYFVDLVQDTEKWRPLLDQGMEMLAAKATNSIFVNLESSLAKSIGPLAPNWEILNIQVAYLPKAKRVRAECGADVHRATVGLTTNGDIMIETEYMSDCQAPRERFVSPIKVAFFIFGRPPGEPKNSTPAAVREGRQEVPQDAPAAAGDPPPRREDVGNGELYFAGPPLTVQQRAVAPIVARLHKNLGHPSNVDLVRLLNQHGGSQEAVDLARRLRCAPCLRTVRPKSPRPARIPTTGPFNSCIALDFVYLHDCSGQVFQNLSILDLSGGLHIVFPSPSRESVQVLELLQTAWFSWAGVPDAVYCDRDGAFAGSVVDWLERHGCDVSKIPAEAHWQAGKIESNHKVFKYITSRVVDDEQLEGPEAMRDLAIIASQSKNARVRSSGMSAYQWTFGRNPSIPDSLLDAGARSIVLENLDADQELRRRQHIRAKAEIALVEYDTSESLRRAFNRRSHPDRGTYQPGEKIAFFRERKKGKLARWVVGTVVGPDRDNYWVSSSGQLLLVSKEQLRPAHGTENWSPTDEDIEELRRLSREAQKTYRDERPGDAPPDLAPPLPIPILIEVPAGGESVRSRELHELDRLPPVPEEDDALLPMAGEPTIFAPSAPALPPPELDAIEPTSSSSASRPRPPSLSPSEVGDVVTKKPRLMDVLACEHDATTPTPPFREVYFVEQDDGVITPELSRDRKALQREIPYDLLPLEHRPLYAEALGKEWSVWLKYGATEALSLDASREVIREMPDRVLASRVCYRNKNAAKPWEEIRPKARLVVRGDKDPDLLSLRRDAPTLMRASLLLILQLCSSFNWLMFSGDVTGAFLQGDQALARRTLPLFMKQPKEGLPGLLPGQILLVIRGIFGLANSPRLWWRHLRAVLLRLGARQSRTDPALFLFFEIINKTLQLVLALGVHVDDLIGTAMSGPGQRLLAKIRASFDFGEWQTSESGGAIKYCGKSITVAADGSVTLCQTDFTKAIVIAPIPKWRAATPTAALTPKEVTELKSAIGSLQWLVGQTRPDLAAGTSLGQGPNPCVGTLMAMNQMLREAIKASDFALRFRPIDFRRACIVVYSDSSWANAPGNASQAGYLVFLAEMTVTTHKGGFAYLLEWRSHRIRRVCRSTLAAECIAMDTGLDAAVSLRLLFAGALIGNYDPVKTGAPPADFLPIVVVTDCKSLYDLCVKDGPSSTQERRLQIDLAAIAEVAMSFDHEDPKKFFFWVPTHLQHADHLTKSKPPHLLRELLREGFFRLRESENAVVPVEKIVPVPDAIV